MKKIKVRKPRTHNFDGTWFDCEEDEEEKYIISTYSYSGINAKELRRHIAWFESALAWMEKEKGN